MGSFQSYMIPWKAASTAREIVWQREVRDDTFEYTLDSSFANGDHNYPYAVVHELRARGYSEATWFVEPVGTHNFYVVKPGSRSME